MKLHFFIFSLLLLLFQQLTAQKTLAPSIQPYAVNFDHTTVKALRRAGYDMPTLKTGTLSSGTESRSNVLRLDSTKTFYGYPPTPNDSFPLFRSIYTYPTPNEKVETNFQYEAEQWFTINRITERIYPSEGKVENIGEGFDPSTQQFIPYSKVVLYPRQNSTTLVDSLYVWVWAPELNDWQQIMSTKNEYDNNNRLIESNSDIVVIGQSLSFSDEYQYDANGDNTLILSYGVLGGQAYLTNMVEIEYIDHLQVSVTASIFELTTPIPQSKATYQYTTFRKDSISNSYEWSNSLNDWQQTEEKTYFYDEQERIEAYIKRFFNQDGTEEREMLNYAYKTDELLAIESSFIWDGGGAFWLADRKFYYYTDLTSNTDNPSKNLQVMTFHPNPATDALQLDLQEPAIVQVFNTSGQQVESLTYTPGRKLAIGDWPAGLYYITAQTERSVFTGKLIKL
jgi:Secretion system C-terminal sorting domain